MAVLGSVSKGVRPLDYEAVSLPNYLPLKGLPPFETEPKSAGPEVSGDASK